MGLCEWEFWSGLPFAPPGELPNLRIEPMSPVLAGGFFTTEPLPCYHVAHAFTLFLNGTYNHPPNTRFLVHCKLCTAMQRLPSLQLLLWIRTSFTALCYFCNVLADVTSADTGCQQEAQIEYLGWEWGGFFLSHVTLCLAGSQSPKEQMQEHIYKAGLWGADAHQARDEPLLLHRQAAEACKAPSCISWADAGTRQEEQINRMQAPCMSRFPLRGWDLHSLGWWEACGAGSSLRPCLLLCYALSNMAVCTEWGKATEPLNWPLAANSSQSFHFI